MNNPQHLAQSGPHSSSTVDSRLTPVALSEFLTQNAPLPQLLPGEVGVYLHQRLLEQPVEYTSILDAIALFRTYLPASGADADYALLMRQQSIIGFVWLTGKKSYESALEVNMRQVMHEILSHDADGVVLATTWGVQDSGLTATRIDDIDDISDALKLFGIRLHDWLTIHPEHTESYLLTGYGEDALSGNINDDDLVLHFDHCTFPDFTEEEGEDDE